MTSVLFAPPVGTQLNRGHPINRGIVGCWLLNEGAGQKFKDIAGVNNAAGTGSPIFAPGQYGKSLNLSGSQYGQVADASAIDLSGGEFTISLWLKGNIASQVTNAALVAKGTGSNNWGMYRSSSTNDLHIFTANDANTGTFTNAFSAVVNGRWSHLVWVQTGGNATIYANGVSQGTVALPSPNETSSPMFIGAGWTGVVPFVGAENNVRIYKRPLSAQEVRQLYVQPFAGLSFYRQQAYNLPNSTYTASLSDSAATSDTFAASGVFAGSLSDSTATSDSFAAVGVFASALSDAGTTSDLFSATGVFAGALNDAAATSDTWSSQAQFSASLSDTAATSDILAASAIFSASLSDAAATSDTWSAQAQFSASLDDTAITSDAWLSQAVLSSDINDIIATSDQFSATGAFLAFLSDVAVTSDRFFVVVPTLTPSRFGTMAIDVRMALMPVDARSAGLVTDVRTGIMPRDQ